MFLNLDLYEDMKLFRCKIQQSVININNTVSVLYSQSKNTDFNYKFYVCETYKNNAKLRSPGIITAYNKQSPFPVDANNVFNVVQRITDNFR